MNDDFRLREEKMDESDAPPIEATPLRGPSLILPFALVAALASGAIYFWFFRTPAVTRPVKTVAETTVDVPPAPGPPAPPLEGITVPPLDESDGLVRQLVSAISSHPEIAAWLATDGLVRNFVVVTDNIADGASPARHLKALAPRGAFAVAGPPHQLTIHPAAYQRYDGIADAVSGLDAVGSARIYATLNRRIEEAYRDLGHPDARFDASLTRAMTRLLSVPVLDDLPLRPHIVSYRLADERLEALSAAEKQLLRMGPRNIRLIQSKIREVAAALGLALPRS